MYLFNLNMEVKNMEIIDLFNLYIGDNPSFTLGYLFKIITPFVDMLFMDTN